MNVVGELVSSQWYVFLAALLVGVALCFCYDLFRVIRRVISHSIRAIMVEDFLFWIVWTLTVMTLLDALDKGAVRGFSLGGVFLGMLLYFFCFSPIVLKVLVFLGKWVKRILLWILRVLLWPGRKFVIFIRPLVRYNREKLAAARKRAAEQTAERAARKKQAALEKAARRRAKKTGDLHGEENARYRKQKQKKEKSHRKNRHS